MKGYLREFLKECESKFNKYPAFMYREEKNIKEISFQVFLTDVNLNRKYFEQFTEKRIGLWAYNSYEWIVAAIAMILAGKTVILLDGNLDTEQLIRLCRYTDAELIVAEEEMRDEEEEISNYFPIIFNLKIDRDDKTAAEPIGRAGTKPHDIREGDIICFTSGTSKSAKGVVITIESICNSIRKYKDNGLMGKAGERHYLPLPYHHIYAFSYIFRFLYYGGIHCIGQMGRYLIEDFDVMKPEIIYCVPSMLRYFLEKDYFPEQLRQVFTGGSYLSPELEKQINLKNIVLCNLYGSSESLATIGFSTQKKEMQWLHPVPGARFISDQNGQLGVILPYYMEEYYKKPEDTREVLDKEQNLLWMGDACELDEEGNVKILGRMRDMIVLENGEKIHAEDTDAELSVFPGVSEAAVISVRRYLIAVFYLESGVEEGLIIQEVKKYNKRRQSAIRIEKIWFRKEEFPRTSTGKLKRTILEQEYKDDFGRNLR